MNNNLFVPFIAEISSLGISSLLCLIDFFYAINTDITPFYGSKDSSREKQLFRQHRSAPTFPITYQHALMLSPWNRFTYVLFSE